MKNGIISLFILISINCSAQCGVSQSIFSNNIYFFSAELNWSSVNNVHHYKVRYKQIGINTWSYKNNIDSTLNSKVLNNLTSQVDYIWQIRSYCDSTNTLFSNWSVVDTFFTSTTLCQTPNGLTSSNITYNSAQANWSVLAGTNRYKIHYRILNTNTWQNLSLVSGLVNNTNIPVLQQNTIYEWQIMAYHDSTLNMGSLWSTSDTFTTGIFVPAPFNPIINTVLGNNQCNTASSLQIVIDQATNEPDIGTSTITTDGGYFDISSVSAGDSVGYAVLNSSSQNINTVLRAGLIAGSNYAIINSFDTANNLIGFFAIENTSNGTRVTTTSPNDGNNYTAGYTSEINFTKLYVTQNYSGNLNIVILLESEFSEQFYYSDTVIIQCASSISEIWGNKEIKKIYNINGQQIKKKKNTILFYENKDGRISKRLIID
ncbi:MAG: hypothetical protein ACKVH2_01000 [Flavobacteriales bacterium]|jgi:hypothetical protein|tara:strand:+ start:53 stop:1342 length:1290 start_codon:yes stop_codon:yes gene_type:complete